MGVKILTTDDASSCDAWVQRHVLSQNCRLLGFDTEWYVAGQGMDLKFRLAIVQREPPPFFPFFHIFFFRVIIFF